MKQKDQIALEFDSWQIYCENQDGRKLATIFLPQNITEYLFTNLGRYPILHDRASSLKSIKYLYYRIITFVFYPDMNVSYTMGLCMVSLGEATVCLTKHIEITQSDLGKFFSD